MTNNSPETTRTASTTSRFSRGERLVAIGSIVLLISFLLPWMSADGGLSVRVLHGAGFITVIGWLAVVVLFVVRSPFLRNTVELPRLPWTDTVLFIVGGVVELAGIIAFHSEEHSSQGYDRSVKFGLVLAVIGALMTIAAGFFARRAGATSLYDASAAGQPVPPASSTGPQPPAPPPVA